MNAGRGEALWRRALGALVLAAALSAFAPALDNAFVDWDDGTFIRDNLWIRGLRPENLSWMLSAGPIFQPLTFLSFAFDHSLWGLEPCGYHLTNILLHAGTALLFFAVCLRLFELARPELPAAQAAALSALFFAVHPLRVESVAWAVERKDVLSGFFFMAAVLSRLRAAAPGSARRAAWEGAAVAAFALALAAKPSVVTLPGVLLVLEVYPLGRLPADPRRWSDRSLRPIWISLTPYVVLAAAGIHLNLALAKESGLLHGLGERGAVWRVCQVLYGALFYPARTLWPAALSPYYAPLPWFGRWSWQPFACAAPVLAGAVWLWRRGRRRPGTAAAFAAYALLLAPMSGVFQHGMALRACDRYSYLSTLGFAGLFGAAFARHGRAARALAAAWLVALGAVTWRQCRVWRDSLTLWEAAAANAPSGFAVSNTGIALVKAGRAREGLARLEEAVTSYPVFPLAYDNLGIALLRDGQEGRAREVWRKGLALEASGDLHAHLGASLASGDAAGLAAGIAHLEAARALTPDAAVIRADLADALARVGRPKAAEAQFAAAARLDPRLGRAQTNWGLLLAGEGRADEARERYRRALYCPDSRAEAHHDWGSLLLEAGGLDAAERHFREAVRLKPALSRAQVNLGNILARRGRLAEAAARYRLALAASPGLPEARANLSAVRKALGR